MNVTSKICAIWPTDASQVVTTTPIVLPSIFSKSQEGLLCMNHCEGHVDSVHESAQVWHHIVIFEGVSMPLMLREVGCQF